MKVTITEAFYITGIYVRTDNRPGRAETAIPALWARFFKEGIMEQLEDRANDTVYSVYTNYESDHTGEYDVILGCRTSRAPNNLPEGFQTIRIEPGEYEKRTAEGDLMQGVVFREWVKIWEAGLNRAFTSDFEVYDERSSDPSAAAVDIYIHLKS